VALMFLWFEERTQEEESYIVLDIFLEYEKREMWKEESSRRQDSVSS
jgi:hypothetical protein